MFNKMKSRTKKAKEYIKLQKYVQYEVIETLIHICMWMANEGHYNRNPYTKYMNSHAKCLMDLGEQLRKELK